MSCILPFSCFEKKHCFLTCFAVAVLVLAMLKALLEALVRQIKTPLNSIRKQQQIQLKCSFQDKELVT